MELVLIFILIIFVGLYFLPTIIALNKNHKKIGPIVIVNFFLGWSLIGWVVALAWSVDSASHQD